MSIALDIAISVAFLFLSLSLITTTVQELIASVFNLRAKTLYDAIEGMLGKGAIDVKTEGGEQRATPLLRALYEHPLLKNLYRSPAVKHGKVDKLHLPSYISSEVFAHALLDVLRGDATVSGAIGLDKVLREAHGTIDNIQGNPQLQRTLKLLLSDIDARVVAGNDLEKKVKERVESWFNDRMARASGWYKRSAQAWALGLAFATAILFNADSIQFVSALWKNSVLRDSVVASASAYQHAHAEAPGGATGTTTDLARAVVGQVQELESSRLPIGWAWDSKHSLCARGSVKDTSKDAKEDDTKCTQGSTGDDALLVLGWLVTAFAVSLGSNFWFDILSKALNLRGTGARVSGTGSVSDKQS
ncbi:MAG TPA: hypothetical protein VER04_00150 [Polyangiaceae bacterium]|nr:hypothetical protein [Polyangiaceae bacterium]